ncbi:hypothetical protein FJTKL_03430 [Diaporthe vaccinii]|uniref:Uncharacterized protein n=1 Tax=Diaporthe vaccinii TaxID=105482 RepID=A0ABR4F251_9PEZI
MGESTEGRGEPHCRSPLPQSIAFLQRLPRRSNWRCCAPLLVLSLTQIASAYQTQFLTTSWSFIPTTQYDTTPHADPLGFKTVQHSIFCRFALSESLSWTKHCSFSDPCRNSFQIRQATPVLVPARPP